MKPFKINKSRFNYTDPHIPRYAQIHYQPSVTKKPTSIKIVSYNIKFSRKVKKAADLLSKYPETHNADILCLQEMDAKGAKTIAETLKYNYIYYPAIVHPSNRRDFGNAILSKWPIITDKKIILPHLDPCHLQRIAVYASIAINNLRIHVFSVHMKVLLKPQYRKDQIKHLIESIPKRSKYCIIAGDFNTFTKVSRKAILPPLQKANFLHASKQAGWTYKHWYLLRKKSLLDHIFSKGMNIVAAGKIVDHTPSDHLPIWSELNL